MIADIFVLAVVAAAGVLFIVFKFGRIRRVLAFDILVDIVATVLLCVGMAGTFTGIMIGLTAGTIISITLFTMKKIMGAESWTRKGWVNTPQPHNFRNWRHKHGFK